MNAKPPETFGLDRLQTPIGTALLVTDGDKIARITAYMDGSLAERFHLPSTIAPRSHDLDNRP